MYLLSKLLKFDTIWRIFSRKYTSVGDWAVPTCVGIKIAKKKFSGTVSLMTFQCCVLWQLNTTRFITRSHSLVYSDTHKYTHKHTLTRTHAYLLMKFLVRYFASIWLLNVNKHNMSSPFEADSFKRMFSFLVYRTMRWETLSGIQNTQYARLQSKIHRGIQINSAKNVICASAHAVDWAIEMKLLVYIQVAWQVSICRFEIAPTQSLRISLRLIGGTSVVYSFFPLRQRAFEI